MLEHNHKTYCAMNGLDVPMNFDVKVVMMEIIESTGFADQRPAKMDNDDYLKLLNAFVSKGFRFTSK